MTSAMLLLPALFLPLLAALLFAFQPAAARPEKFARMSLVFAWVYASFAVLASVAAMSAPAPLTAAGSAFRIGVPGFEFQPRLFLDGRSALFLLLLGLCLPVVFTFLRDREGRYGKSYYAAAWMLAFSLAGVFLADSLLLFFLFWETSLLAVYFWIGLHGRPDARGNAVYPVLLRFVLITLAGSLPMLVSIGAVCAESFRDPGLQGLAATVARLEAGTRAWVFLGFFLGFAVKLPLFGFHGWLRDTYNVAPAACRALLSAAMSKMGAFGLILILAPAFAEELTRFATPLQILAAAGAVYGGVLMLSQKRLLDLLAYGSLSHLSLIALGVFASVSAGAAATSGISGAVLLAFNHALIMVLLFSLDARVLRGGESPDRELLAGLRERQGRLFAFLLLAAFASASLPGLNNFPGEVLIFFAAFKASPWLAFLGGLGAILGAAAMVRVIHQIFLGVPAVAQPGAEPAPDLNRAETGVALGMTALWIALGLYPMLLLGPVEKAVSLVHSLGGAG